MPDLKSVIESTTNWALQRQLAVNADVQTGSTNDNAKAAAFSEKADLALYLTSHQTAGRGRGSNQWLDTGAGDSLLMTMSYALPSAPQAITAPRIGLALFGAALKTWPSVSWALKAPNDLVLNAKKTAGLLVESVTNGKEHRLIIGLGFNVLNHPRSFIDATHLSAALGSVPSDSDWFRFMDELSSRLNQALSEIVQPTLSESARADLIVALNAHPNRKFTVREISPMGDLIHDSGQVRWTEL